MKTCHCSAIIKARHDGDYTGLMCRYSWYLLLNNL